MPQFDDTQICKPVSLEFSGFNSRTSIAQFFNCDNIERLYLNLAFAEFLNLYGHHLQNLKLLSIRMKEYDPQAYRALDQLPAGLTLNKVCIKHETTEEPVNYLLSEILLNWKPARSKLTLFHLPKKGTIKFDIQIENFNISVPASSTN